jgi:hypothetical protein
MSATLRNRGEEYIPLPSDPWKCSQPDLVAVLDKLASKACRSQAQNRCAFEGIDGRACSGLPEAAHVVKRGKSHVRHEPRNLLCLCHGHHSRYENSSEWEGLVEKATGEERVQQMLATERAVKAEYGDNLRRLYVSRFEFYTGAALTSRREG